jgi:predicted RNA binding protein YcfA (HicA-like mRNA interferase family)
MNGETRNFIAQVIQWRGWTLARVHGSYQVFIMAGRRERIVIPIHGNQPSEKGLLRSLMKIAGLKEDDL